MNLKQTRLHILHEKKDLSPEAKTGVSLHCHTRYSKEMLDFVPYYAEQLPIIAYFWRKERDKFKRLHERTIDFTTAYWQPPMPEETVYNVEKKQINDAGLEALVSLTDHDSIDANLKINEQTANEYAPISMEWTVPFDYGFFHVGIHNLPKDRAADIAKQLLDYTFTKEKPSNEHLHNLFTMLREIPDVLVVLNHPLWDIEMVGKERHKVLLRHFLKEFSRHIHAFEVNGFRKWSENKAVIELAEALGIPLVTGGDRHGCQPNTVINLTDAKTFSEFAEEIRKDKHSEIVFMPEYKEPLKSRQLQSFAEILKPYPEFDEDRRRWVDRVHFDIGDGNGLLPVATHWDHGGPMWLKWAIRVLAFSGSRTVRPLFRMTMNSKDRVPKDAGNAKFSSLETKDYIAGELSSDTIS